MLKFPRLVTILSCILLSCGIMGCATFHLPFLKRMPKASAADPVVQILCLWQPAEGRDPDGMPCRGFQGQILFLSNRAATPVEVEGDVRIYLFDDQGTEEEQTKPLHVYNFDNGSWSVHLTETSFGPTYSVFVPYTRRAVRDANCALRIRLKSKYGGIVFSDMSNLPLSENSGVKKPVMGDEAKPLSNEDIEEFGTESLTNRLRRTTTISMGPNPKTTETLVSNKPETNASEVVTASHQVVVDETRESDADRIRRLESMVQQLLEQKSDPSASASTVSPPKKKLDRSVLEELENDRPKDNSLTEPRRVPEQSFEVIKSKRITPRRRHHPLADDERATVPTAKDANMDREPSFGNPFESKDD